LILPVQNHPLGHRLSLQRHLTHGLSYMPLRDVVIAHFSRPPWGPILPVGVPTTHMPAPWTPGRSLGAGKVLDTARIRSPWRSSEVRQPRVLTSRGLCITPVAPWGRPCWPCGPAVWSSAHPSRCPWEHSVVMAQAWGRRPATRGRGSVGHAGTLPPADGTIPPRSRRWI